MAGVDSDIADAKANTISITRDESTIESEQEKDWVSVFDTLYGAEMDVDHAVEQQQGDVSKYLTSSAFDGVDFDVDDAETGADVYAFAHQVGGFEWLKFSSYGNVNVRKEDEESAYLSSPATAPEYWYRKPEYACPPSTMRIFDREVVHKSSSASISSSGTVAAEDYLGRRLPRRHGTEAQCAEAAAYLLRQQRREKSSGFLGYGGALADCELHAGCVLDKKTGSPTENMLVFNTYRFVADADIDHIDE